MGPLVFEPILKRIRWGGRRLGTVLGKVLGEAADYAESWEIVDHGADQSIVADGPFRGWTLHRLIETHRNELLGNLSTATAFPLLVKFLDANDRLSVQVHPNDEQASRHVPGARGKTEAWVILDAAPGSCLFAGLKTGIDRSALEHALAAGNVEDCLHRVPVAAGDSLLIPAGTVHAIGEGVLLAEIQQSSDLTFRLFDWNRVGSDGKPRPLHIRESLQCIDFSRGPIEKVVPRLLVGTDHPTEELVRCAYFTIRRHQLTAAAQFPIPGRCRILIVLAGELHVRNGAETILIRRGQTALIPAAVRNIELVPTATATILEAWPEST